MVRKTIAVPVLIVGLLVSMAFALSDGPPDEASGAPDEATCVVCHGDFALNSGIGSMGVTAGPTTYGPGDTIDLVVGLEHPGQERWGFEMTILTEDLQPVGQLLLDDASRTQYSEAPNTRQYVKHTQFGTYPGVPDSCPGWLVPWVAPTTSAGPVTVYASGNAADNDGISAGDYVYTAEYTLQPEEPFPCCYGMTGNVNDDPNEEITLSDLTLLVNHLFVTFEPLPCPAEANTSGDPEGMITLTDLSILVAWMFVTFEPTAPCQ